MLKLLALAVGLACVGYVALAQETGGVIRSPEWAAKPSGRDVANYYPDSASRKAISGWALISCRVGAGGFLKGCRVAAEAPEGWHFGDATVALSNKFRMKNTAGETKALEGGKVRIPVVWMLEGKPPPPKTFSAGDPSMVIAELAGDAKGPGVFECPTADQPQRRCQGKAFSWAQQPFVEDIAKEIRSAGDGRSVLECVADAAGALQGCRVANKSKLADADLVRLTGLFKAPPTTEDGTPTAGKRVALTFEWKVLAQVLAAVEAT